MKKNLIVCGKTIGSWCSRVPLALGAVMTLAAPSAAHADTTCPSLLARHFDWDANGPDNLIRFQNIQFVYIKDNGAWTMWSAGRVYYNGGVGGTDLLQTLREAPLRQLFSDRQSHGQPFFATSFDETSVTGIARDGTVTLYNITWKFYSQVNATCAGNTLTARSADGLLIITLTDASTPRTTSRSSSSSSTRSHGHRNSGLGDASRSGARSR